MASVQYTFTIYNHIHIKKWFWITCLLEKIRCKASSGTDQIIDFWYLIKWMDHFFSLICQTVCSILATQSKEWIEEREVQLIICYEFKFQDGCQPIESLVNLCMYSKVSMLESFYTGRGSISKQIYRSTLHPTFWLAT